MHDSTNQLEMSTPTCSERFSAADSDLTFESCDHVLFRVHRRNLECHSEGFSPPDGTSSFHEIVPLPESGAVLELLFQYMYPQRQPDLAGVGSEVVIELAEAAEKYQVYAAMPACHIMMRDGYQEHSLETLLYGARHGYPKLVELTEKSTVLLSPAEALKSFPVSIFVAWTQYYAQWTDVLRQAFKYQQIFSKHSDVSHRDKIAQTLARLGMGPASLRDLDATFQPLHDMLACPYCNVGGWRAFVEGHIASLKSFNAFL